MACPGVDSGRYAQHQHLEAAFESAFKEAQNWIEAVTGRPFGDEDFRAGLENGVLLCELLSAIKPGLVKKINRFPTPIAGLDNLNLFLRGCEVLGLKGTQLFEPGDLQDCARKGFDCSRKLKNVLITIYWLGRTANNRTSYSGPTLDLKEFEGLLSQMRKEAEHTESPKRSVRDSGYVDCWDSERSDSLSPPRHVRDNSFDSLDSFGSRSQQTPSPDVVFRGSSDGRGSDSEGDMPQRRLPDVRRDDMLARRLSCSELRTVIPFNQYLPNRSNQSSYVPSTPRRRPDTEEFRKSWSTATSPVGADRPFRYSHRGSVSDDPESVSMIDMRCNDVFLPAHTQVRHDHMHNQYNQFREEESHWQADLARWKSRRRSISQDLIKKEEERKMMEKMMTGDNNLSQRRKSFKTYKEIVEEKERREKELHEAYQNARTPQEAEDVLHRYAQRFSISEAVLTQLRLPRTLERSMSAEPATPAQEPSPMKYLRQQSLPVPRFTSTVEAIVAGVPHTQTQENSPPQASAHGPASSQVSSSCTLQKNPQAALASVQVHQTAQVDGDPIQEFSSSGDCAGGREASSPKRPIPSPTLPVVFESTAWVPLSPRRELTAVLDLRPEDPAAQRGPPGPESCSTTALSPENRPTRPTSLPAQLQNVNSDQFAASSSEPLQSDIEGNVTPENFQNSEGQTVEETSSADVEATVTAKKLVATASLHMTSSSARRAHGTDACGIEENRIRLVRTDCIFGKPTSEAGMKFKTHVTHEKYQLKQEKLRQNWERAQREVEAEECRYHEEERRILEETVVPLLPRPSTLTSPRHGEPGLPIVRSLADWERKQELLERQMKGLDEEYLQPGDRSDAVMKQKIPKESGATTESAWVHSYSQAAPIGHAQQNGQRKPGDLSQLGTAESRVPQGSSCDRKNQKMEEPWSKTASLEYIWGFQQLPSWEMQRTGSCKYMENNSSKLPPSSRPSDVQSQVPNRSVSGKKLCSSCGQPLGRGAAMIIETLSLYFHIGCFKCGICKGQLGDTSTGTDVRIRNGLLNCHQCYVRSRVAGQPTTL